MRDAAASIARSPYWWEQLPEDLCKQPDVTELDQKHRIKVAATAMADHVLRAGLGGLISGSITPGMIRPGRMRREMERLAFYQPYAERGDVAESFVAPSATVVKERKPRLAHYRPRGIPATDLYFDSPYRTLNPDLQADYERFKANRTAHAQYWHHPSGPRKTLIFVHGVVESWYALNSLGFSLKWFYRHGYDIVLFTLPFHGYRADWRSGPAGVGFFRPGFAHVNEAMLQGVCDLRVVLDDLFARGVPSVGISGLSLGGYHSAMLATADPRLSFCIPNSPVVSPIDMALDWPATSPFLRMLMRMTGIGVTEMRQALAVHSPLSYQPQLDTDRVLIIGGAGDRLTSPKLVRLLHEHWQGAHFHWFPGNHVIHLRQGEYLKEMLAFMNRHSAE